MNKQILLEKYIKVAVRKALKEQEEQQKRAEKSLCLIYRFPGLKKLINGQDFTIIYIGKGKFTVKIAGKKYNPYNLGELERVYHSNVIYFLHSQAQ